MSRPKRYSAERAAKIIEDFYDSELYSCDDHALIAGPGGDERTIYCDYESDSESNDSSISTLDEYLPLKKRLNANSLSLTSDVEDCEYQNYTSRNGQVWIRSSNESDVGRSPSQKIFRANAGVTTKTRATVSEDSKKSAFSLLIDE